MWVYNKELCLQDSIWRQERTKHNYQYRHIGVLLACLHLVWRCCVARRKERIHSCSPCCLTEIFLALESASSLFAAIPPGFGSTASLSGIPLTHCLGPAPHVYTWQHVSLLCCGESSVCCLSSAGDRGHGVGRGISRRGAGHHNRSNRSWNCPLSQVEINITSQQTHKCS